MSKFRELVENIRNCQEDTTSSAPQQSEPEYKFLTPEYQAALDWEIEAAQDDVEIGPDFPTAYWEPNPYGVEERLIGSSGCWEVRDESYIWDAACDRVLSALEGDDLAKLLDADLSNMSSEDYDALLNEAFTYVEKQKWH